MEERCNVIVFSPVAQQPSSGVEDGLQAIQEALRRANQQTVPATDLRCDEGSNSRSRSLERQRFDAAFQKTKLTEAATDGPSHVVAVVKLIWDVIVEDYLRVSIRASFVDSKVPYVQHVKENRRTLTLAKYT